jgi:hypothetical protein
MMGDYEIDVDNQIVVGYRADDKWSGKLIIRASYEGFSGVSEAWIDLEKVVTFANSLTRYPIESDLPIRIASGFGSPEVLDQELVALEVGPVGIKGQLGVKVHLASPLWPDDRTESLKEVRFEFLTTYQRLSTFSQDLSNVLRGTLSEAALGSEKLR